MASPLLACSLAVLTATVGLGPPPPNLRGAAVFAPAGDYDAALAAIDEANTAVNRDPEANVAALEQAIADLMAHASQVAADPKGRDALDLSQLNLARALLVMEQEDKAAAIMDAVLLTAHDRKLPVKRFGPTLIKFHDQRRKLLDDQGTASIQVHCSVSCRVVVDEQQVVGAGSGPLYLGAHRIFIEAVDGGVEALRRELVLDDAGAIEVLNFPADVPTAECEPAAPVQFVETQSTPLMDPKRILPRWAEIGVAVIGVGAVVAGGVLLGLDGKCVGGGDPVTDAQSCPELYEGTLSGLVAIGVGSALTVTGTVLIAVDEVRIGKQTGRQAIVGWQLRF